MSELLHKALTASILRAYYTAYNGTSRIYPERFYDRAITHELLGLGIHCRTQPEWQIFYKDKIVGKQILDILVADEVVIENKVASNLTRLHKAQLISYLKTTQKQIGLLLNFGSAKPEFKRVYFTSRESQISKTQVEKVKASQPSAKLIDPALVYEVINALFEIHSALGPGFIHRIYANACHHEFKLRGLAAKPLKAIQVYYRDICLGELALSHFQIGDSLLVFPVAIQDSNDLHPDMLSRWMRTQNVPLGLIANFYDTSLTPKFLKTQLD
jgi:GxxExxY protein